MLIDFHTHLLPAIDDGSRSVAESLEMLEALRFQNVHCVVATPHFYSNKTSLADFLTRRNKAYEMLQSQCQNMETKVFLGAEVTLFRGIGKAEGIEKLCITGTNALLIEMPFTQWRQSEVTELSQMLNRGITPIIAHIERYFPFQRDMSVFNSVINLPVYLQVNAEALKPRRSRKFVFQLIQSGFSILLGTDCHNMKSRKPNLAEGRNTIQHTFGDACLEQIDAMGAQVLKLNDACAVTGC